ncbi:hypothetical protein CRV15_29400 (plasmid) [Streptomyces clavuligerus]|nr:hypothetical protein CRV15_29400 [Streptomyces clavuligerus]
MGPRSAVVPGGLRIRWRSWAWAVLVSAWRRAWSVVQPSTAARCVRTVRFQRRVGEWPGWLLAVTRPVRLRRASTGTTGEVLGFGPVPR